jgi:hypothetical protein
VALGERTDGVRPVGRSSLSDCRYQSGLARRELLEAIESWSGWEWGWMSTDVVSGDGPYILVECPDPVIAGGRWAIWPQGDPPPREMAEGLAREARARAEVPLPTPQGAPDGVDVPYLVHLPTWWWLDDSDWRSVSASASFAGADVPRVTATLSPQSATWTVADGEPVVCAQGVPWDASSIETIDGWCGATFSELSGPDGVPLRVEVTFEVELACVPVAMCDSIRPLPPVEVASTTQVQVIQARGVVTG